MDRRKVVGLGENVKGLKNTNWQLQNSHEDVKYNIKNIVDNIVVIMNGVR